MCIPLYQSAGKVRLAVFGHTSRELQVPGCGSANTRKMLLQVADQLVPLSLYNQVQ
jgi:hypothetical protein